jgi:transcriptional regulator with XRE-family HTH domain
MTAGQFRAALRRLGLSQLEAARRMGVDARTVRRWATLRARKASPVPSPVGLLLEAWLRERRRYRARRR